MTEHIYEKVDPGLIEPGESLPLPPPFNNPAELEYWETGIKTIAQRSNKTPEEIEFYIKSELNDGYYIDPLDPLMVWLSLSEEGDIDLSERDWMYPDREYYLVDENGNKH